ncbi:MAG: DHA2 family efflux MFS transporter permease subunit [Pseudomonadota bacterium]
MPLIKENARKYWVLAAMGTVLGIVVLDETVVGVALPTMTRDLGLSTVGSHWVVNAYLLVFAGLAAAAGRLGDIVGLKTLFIIGLAIFGLASLASGFAQSGVWLITARAIQGVGAAIVFPASLAMITHAFPPEQRGMAMGIYGAVGTFFLALGPFAGGFLSEFLSWRWIFWINPPIVIAIGAVVVAVWRDPPRGPAVRLDVPGLITLVAGLGLVVFAIMQGPDWGWTHLTIWLVLAAGLVITLLFVVVELRTAHPLIDVALFRNGAFSSFNLVIFLAQFSKLAVFIFIAAYLQDRLGFSAMIAGVILLAGTVPPLLTSLPTGMILDRVGARALLLGGLLASFLSMLWLALAVTWDSFWALLPAMIIWGGCVSILFVPSLRDVMDAVSPDKRGQAGGISMTAQLLGGTVGMTVCGTLFAVTGAYWTIFLLTAVLFLIVLVVCWRTLSRLAKP